MIHTDPPLKSCYKTYIKTMITSYHEKKLRELASNNSCMKYFNVGLLGLGGKCHPIIADIQTTSDVRSMKPMLKMMVGNYRRTR